MMQEIGKLKFKRIIVPADAVTLDINTIEAADASNKIACAAIYARFLKKDGEYSCQLIFSRSKIVPDGLSQPRAKLFAATMNSHTGEIVKRSLQNRHKEIVKLTDSQVVLHWINNYDKPMKQWVRNKVVEINRFTETSEWMFVNSANMIADIGTRRVEDIKLVDQNSTWINGFEWMKKNKIHFPTKTITEITLSNKEISEVQNENLAKYSQDINEIYYKLNEENKASYSAISINNPNDEQKCNILNEVNQCYDFSKYLLDPNKYRFKTIVRIMAFVFKFINNARKNTKRISSKQNKEDDMQGMVLLTDNDIEVSKRYLFKKATLEVKRFLKASQYEKISIEKHGILFYSGRILPTDTVNTIGEISSVVKDLSSDTFCVPLVYKHSQLSY